MSEQIRCQNQVLPAYSGITINITSPTLNAAPIQGYGDGANLNAVGVNVLPQQNPQPAFNQQYVSNPYSNPNAYYSQAEVAQSVNDKNRSDINNTVRENSKEVYTTEKIIERENNAANVSDTQSASKDASAVSYPAPYYMNNYNLPQEGINDGVNNGVNPEEGLDPAKENKYINRNADNDIIVDDEKSANNSDVLAQAQENKPEQKTVQYPYELNKIQNIDNESEEADLSTSQEIIRNIDEQLVEEKRIEQEKKQTKVVALTNEYIMSLENYLDNPNTEIRLMAAKDILTRFNEDRDRYDDAALNALLNKMLQDPAKLVRIAALSALSSDLASGNDYTIELLHRIQDDPNSDQQDVLEVAQILLNRSATKEVRYVQSNEQKQNNIESKNE